MTVHSLAPASIPTSLAHLDLQRSANTIIERVLQFGNREEIHWLFSVYPRQQVTDWVRQWGSYALPEPHLTFWKLIFDPLLTDAASIRLIERLDFRREAHFIENEWFKGRWSSEYWYALLAQEWLERSNLGV